MIERTVSSFGYAWNGLRTVWQEELNFRIEVCIAIVVLCFAYYLDFTFVETALVVVAIIMVLGAEIINTAIEDLCNKVEPTQDPTIGKVKDIMAALSLITVIGSLALATIMAYHHFKV